MATNMDTLSTYEAIAAAGVDDKAARAISKAIEQSHNQSRSDLATKTDLDNVRVKLEAEFTVVRGEMKTLAADIGTKIADAQTASIRWTAGLLVAAVGTIIALIKLL